MLLEKAIFLSGVQDYRFKGAEAAVRPQGDAAA